jgi:HEPN domain-containing protein
MPGVKDWVRKASNDLHASQKLADEEKTFDCSVFHTHQRAEKAFKAFIVSTQKSIPKTHDLGFLLSHCAEVDSEFMLLQEESKHLNPYANDSRYPNDYFYVNQQIVSQAVDMAEKILIFVSRKIEKGLHHGSINP